MVKTNIKYGLIRLKTKSQAKQEFFYPQKAFKQAKSRNILNHSKSLKFLK